MGAWGHGNFVNDDALDSVIDLEKSTDTSLVVKALDDVIERAGDYPEAPECSVALAAAEVRSHPGGVR